MYRSRDRKSTSPIGRPGRVYFPRMINAPAAIARIDMITHSPEKLRLKRGMSPDTISQMPSKSMPRFFVGFMVKLLM